MPKSVNGKSYARALEYVYRACPNGDRVAGMAHVVFVRSKIVAADGDRWHVGYVNSVQPHPVAVTRSSVRALLLGLEYAAKMSKDFTVHQEGLVVEIHYGHKVLEHELEASMVGAIPGEWEGPVSAEAPVIDQRGIQLHGDQVAAACKWEKGLVTFRSEGDKRPIRADVTVEDELVATAYLLPVDHARAQLPPNEPLLERGKPAKARRGQSILDLQLDIFAPPAQAASCIKIGDVEINTTGLADPDGLARSGPCPHRQDNDLCIACTQDAVQAERDRIAAEMEAKVVPIKKRKGKKKDADAPAPESPDPMH